MSARHAALVRGDGWVAAFVWGIVVEGTVVVVIDRELVQPAITSTARAPEIIAKADPRRCLR
jgi:hypothetical protein